MQLMELANDYCYNNLSKNLKFLIEPSGTENHPGMNEFEKRNLLVINRYHNKLLSEAQIIGLLFQENQVPSWINMTVYEFRTDMTVIHLLCSRRLRKENELYGEAVLYPPFNTLVPIPPDALRKEINDKFDGNWKKELDNRRHSKGIFSKFKLIFRRMK